MAPIEKPLLYGGLEIKYMGILSDNIFGFGFPRVPMQRTYMWECMMPDIWGMSNAVDKTVSGIAGKTVGDIAGHIAKGLTGRAISKFCQDVEFGEYNINDIVEMNIAAFKRFFPGLMSIPDPKITFVAPIPDVIGNYFSAWRRLIVDDDGFYHKASDYKKSIYIFMYDRTGILSKKIRLVGVFPKSFPAWRLSYGDENVVKYTIEFKVDRIEDMMSSFKSAGMGMVTSGGVMGKIGKSVFG